MTFFVTFAGLDGRAYRQTFTCLAHALAFASHVRGAGELGVTMGAYYS